MFKIKMGSLLLLLAMVVSCNFTEEIFLEENGSGKISINFDGSELKNITPEKGTHTAKFSDDYSYFVDTYSSTTTPPISVLRNNKGEKVLELETADITALKEKNWQQPQPARQNHRHTPRPARPELYQ